MADGILTPCNMTCRSEIVKVYSQSGSTLQCDTWLWDDMPLNLPGCSRIGPLQSHYHEGSPVGKRSLRLEG